MFQAILQGFREVQSHLKEILEKRYGRTVLPKEGPAPLAGLANSVPGRFCRSSLRRLQGLLGGYAKRMDIVEAEELIPNPPSNSLLGAETIALEPDSLLKTRATPKFFAVYSWLRKT